MMRLLECIQARMIACENTGDQEGHGQLQRERLQVEGLAMVASDLRPNEEAAEEALRQQALEMSARSRAG